MIYGYCATSNKRADMLRQLFQDVAPKDNWKGPITTMVPADMADLYSEAVTFMTGARVYTGGKVRRLQPGTTLTTDYVCLTSDGYYKAVGA